MKKFIAVVLMAVMAVALFAPIAFAEEGAAAISDSMLSYFGMAVLGCGLAIGLAGLGTGIGMGTAINAALSGIARNPEATGKIQTNMIIGLALIESLCIYALVICFIMVFKVPALETIIEKLAG